jgi:hypothetical protein
LPKAAPITATPGVKGWTEVEANRRLSGNFYVGRRPGIVKGFAEFSGRWNAISKDGNLRNENEIITSFNQKLYMKTIQLTFNLSEDLAMKSIVYSYNDTDLPSNSETLGNIAIAMLRSLNLNKDDLIVQDLLIELDIKRS